MLEHAEGGTCRGLVIDQKLCLVDRHEGSLLKEGNHMASFGFLSTSECN